VSAQPRERKGEGLIEGVVDAIGGTIVLVLE
jgi:hypothetical protein